jgi:hypothetical protein
MSCAKTCSIAFRSLNFPTGTAADREDNLYIADFFNGVVRKVDIITGIITTVAGTGINGFSGDGGPATSAELDCHLASLLIPHSPDDA